MAYHLFERFTYLDDLIRHRKTGTPARLARRFDVHERTIFLWLRQLKEMGAPIGYDRCKETYYYKESVHFVIEFQYDNDE